MQHLDGDVAPLASRPEKMDAFPPRPTAAITL